MLEKSKKVAQSRRYFLLTSVIAVISVLILLFLYRQLFVSGLITQEKRSNVDIAYIVNHYIWPEYGDFFNVADRLPTGELIQHPKIKQLSVDIQEILAESNIVKIMIYNAAGFAVFSSDPDKFGENISDEEDFQKALAGEVNSEISSKKELLEGGEHEKLIESYIPIHSADGKRIEGVLEVYSDANDLFNQIYESQYTILVVTFSSLGSLLIWVLFAMRRADNNLREHEQERQQHMMELMHQAYTDSLTNLPNRKCFKSHLEESIGRANRTQTSLAVLFLDMDGFKLINDSMGHAKGDEVLRLIAKKLQKCIRETDTLFRMGGDEFCIIHEGVKKQNDAVPLVQRLHSAMNEPMEIDHQTIVLGISIGIALYPDDHCEAESLLMDADAAMYAAKAAGRNQYSFYSKEMNKRAKDRLAFETNLMQAFNNQEFSLYYQPRVSGGEGDKRQLLGVEALLRWEKEGVVLAPNDFIPVLERTGLIIPVGEWVLREACRQAMIWQKQGYPPFKVSVNISFVQFQTGDLVETVRQALKQSGLSAACLELELTESILIDTSDTVLLVLNRLKELGVSIAIDDFGTGYSSLSYLKSFPIDYIKIDRSFISDLPEGGKDAAITEAIVSMAQALDINLVAEGVETIENMEFLRKHADIELQGFLFSRPLPASEFAEYHEAFFENKKPSMQAAS